MLAETGLPLGELPDRVPSSRNAQRVALSAGERRGELLQAFEDAYWARGRDIGDDEVIVEEAVAAGLAEDDVQQSARRRGVSTLRRLARSRLS